MFSVRLEGLGKEKCWLGREAQHMEQSPSPKTNHIRYPTVPACPALYLQKQTKDTSLLSARIFTVKRYTSTTGVNQMRKKVKTKSSVLQIVAVNIVHRPLLRVYGFHTGECSASQTTHTAPGWCPQRGRGVEDRIVDESQHSSRHQLSMFGKVHLQFRDAMIGSHTPTRLKGREEENSR